MIAAFRKSGGLREGERLYFPDGDQTNLRKRNVQALPAREVYRLTKLGPKKQRRRGELTPYERQRQRQLDEYCS